MNPKKEKEKEKSNTYRVKNERALGEYLPKKDEESDRGFIEGRQKGQSIESGEKKNETKQYLIRREIMKMLLIR